MEGAHEFMQSGRRWVGATQEAGLRHKVLKFEEQ